MLMFALDIPHTPVMDSPVLFAQATTSGSTPSFKYIFRGCQETQPTPDDPKSAMRGLGPAEALRNYYVLRGRTVNVSEIQTKPLERPRHGELTVNVYDDGLGYRYEPRPGFLGNDQATFEASYRGALYKIILNIKVLHTVDERSSTCPEPRLIQVKPGTVSKPASSASGPNINGVAVRLDDLPWSALGAAGSFAIALDTKRSAGETYKGAS